MLTGEKQDGEANSVARRRAAGSTPPPPIARRSWCGRRPNEVDDGRGDLQDKRASKSVQKGEQGEGKEVGCRGVAELAGVGRGKQTHRRRFEL